ncbi:MAG: carbamoyltransferase HypF [Armatimonadota bacterium]
MINNIEIKTQNRRSSISVNGTVQGVGFRPFVYKLAKDLDLSGWVCNTGNGVLIEIEGKEENILSFMNRLKTDKPPLARISGLTSDWQAPLDDCDFIIRHSDHQSGVHTSIPPDIAMCPDCHADIVESGNRRFGYPFTNCTNCGPRFTIIQGVPYDRPYTTMASFEMCDECRYEYENPLDRRFHAQPNACPVCGPHLSLDNRTDLDDWETLTETVRLLRDGKIIAIKGLGGYHLVCDATNTQAVRELRIRKGRGGKPFALMCSDLDVISRICRLDAASEKLLQSPEKPIVILPTVDGSSISCEAAPGVDSLGVMLPYTPLHQLLLAESPDVLVMTSGNLSEEPIIHDDDEAIDKLGQIADHILSHNRPIHMACDDSVARVMMGAPVILRRARGYVPQPVELNRELPHILACGGDLKNTFCITKDNLALLSQHMGDLENVAAMRHFEHTVEHFCRFFDVDPEIIAYDLHPGYHSSEYAKSIDGPVHIGIQHHHAHIAACLAENMLDEPVIGVAFDGTGYGIDGNIWGSEFMIADYNNFNRVAHLAYIPMPGGESAIHRPSRMALAYLLNSGCDIDDIILAALLPDLSSNEVGIVRSQFSRRINSPLTSSMGRLFDAVSALLGICSSVTYEGQAAIELEKAAFCKIDHIYKYELIADSDGKLDIDVAPLICDIVDNIRHGIGVDIISGRFHCTIADIILQVCKSQREIYGLNKVVLSGGVFQNSLLLERSIDCLSVAGFEVFRHGIIPPNDGGISIGQALIATARYKKLCV